MEFHARAVNQTEASMQIGVVGLGRMGGNIARRLMRKGHVCVVHDTNKDAIAALAREGAQGADTLEALLAALEETPAAVWVMLPAGEITNDTVHRLAARMRRGDIVIDGGNTFYKDDIRRAAALRENGVRYVDVGTSGGVWGLERGYCMMIGGDRDAVEHLDPIFDAL